MSISSQIQSRLVYPREECVCMCVHACMHGCHLLEKIKVVCKFLLHVCFTSFNSTECYIRSLLVIVCTCIRLCLCGACMEYMTLFMYYIYICTCAVYNAFVYCGGHYATCIHFSTTVYHQMAYIINTKSVLYTLDNTVNLLI